MEGLATASADLLRRRADLEVWGRSLADHAPPMRSEVAGRIEAAGLGVPILTLTPLASRRAAPHVFVHGGAWCMGSSRVFIALLRRMADQCRRPIVSINYPLAPEHPYPAAIDAVAAALGAIAGAAGIAGLIGGSAGCHVALAALLRIRDAGAPLLPRAALLWNPALTQGCESWSHRAFGTGHGLATADLREAIALYAVPPDDPLADIAAMALSGLPPTWIACGDRDPLLDDSLRAFARFCRDGVETHLSITPGATHGFMNRWFADESANQAVTQALDWIEDRCMALREA